MQWKKNGMYDKKLMSLIYNLTFVCYSNAPCMFNLSHIEVICKTRENIALDRLVRIQ